MVTAGRRKWGNKLIFIAHDRRCLRWLHPLRQGRAKVGTDIQLSWCLSSQFLYILPSAWVGLVMEFCGTVLWLCLVKGTEIPEPVPALTSRGYLKSSVSSPLNTCLY